MEAISKTYLQTTNFQFLENWSVQYLLESLFTYNEDFKLVKIGNFLRRNKMNVVVDDNKTYKRVTIRNNNGGVFLRNTEIGTNIGTKKQFKIKAGQFLISKIDARNGAIGVVPKEVDNAIITGNFWTFDIDNSIINPFFLVLITTTPEFIRFCENASNGTTNRHYLQEDLFLAQKIPLPSLTEQNRIVEAYNKRIKLAQGQEKKAKELEKGVEDYVSRKLGIVRNESKANGFGMRFISYKDLNRWALSYIFKDQLFSFEKVQYSIKPIKSVLIFFEGGKTPSTRRKDFWRGNINWTSAKDMKELFLNDSKNQITSLAIKEANMKVYPKGTILGVFRSGILRHSFPVALTQMQTTINQDLKAMGVEESIVDKKYFLFYLNTFQKLILERAQKFGVTVESINTDEFMEIPVVLPPLAIQNEIASTITQMKTEIKELKTLAESNRKMAIKEFENEIFKTCN